MDEATANPIEVSFTDYISKVEPTGIIPNSYKYSYKYVIPHNTTPSTFMPMDWTTITKLDSPYPTEDKCPYCLNGYSWQSGSQEFKTICNHCQLPFGQHSPIHPHNSLHHGTNCNGFIWPDGSLPEPKLQLPVPDKEMCQYCIEGGFQDHAKYDTKCVQCGRSFTSHSGKHPHRESWYGQCTGFVWPVVKQTTSPESELAPQWVLDLVLESVPADWHKHKNPSTVYPGGWVYKMANVHPKAWVHQNAAVYGTAKVAESAYVWDSSRVYGNADIASGSWIKNNAKVTGKIGPNCSVRDNSEVHGVLKGGNTISNDTIIFEDVTVAMGINHHSTPIKFRTQKAKGLKALSEQAYNVPSHTFYEIERFKTEKELQSLVGKFVRPCPVTPRHGFVDSRSVKTLSEAKQVISEAAKADPLAEIIAMPFIEATHSGIWTEGQLSVGSGNDGATSGRESLIIPVQGTPDNQRGFKWEKLLKDAGITESPYVELLWTRTDYEAGKYLTNYVQLRNGPKLPDSIDFIPTKMLVAEIVKAEGDLLEWESKVKTFKPGTVVYHPGGTLASHYAVHAFLSGIPVLISREPVVGETLEPNTTTPEPDISKLRSGFFVGCTSKKIDTAQAVYVMLSGCHSTTKWLGRCDFLLGLAMGCTYRLLVTACLGEFRHRDRGNEAVAGAGHNSGCVPTRETIYRTAWNKTLWSTSREKYLAALNSFDKESWRGSLGGPKWFLLSRWAGVMFNSLLDGDIKQSLEYLNKAVNSVHNGGWTFNKFADDSAMNMAANNPLYAVLKIAPVLYDMSKIKFSSKNRLSRYGKFEIADLNVEEYTQKRINKSSAEKVGKICCKSDCCGNPECAECHPVEVVKPEIENPFKSCPCMAPGKDGTSNHSGEESVSFSNGMYSFPVCQNHYDNYLTAGFVLLSSPAVVNDECDCGDHGCEDCYPDGCDCDCTDCHDDGCSSCCNCKEHDCSDCYPGGCDCTCTECHDDGCSDCTPKSEPEEEIAW